MNHCGLTLDMAVPCLAQTGGTQGRAGQGRAGQALAQTLAQAQHNDCGYFGGAQQQRPLEGLVVCFENRADEAKSREGSYRGCVMKMGYLN
jgi:hypothetical protein